MCGLAGYARKADAPDGEIAKLVFVELLRSIGHRGQHATGIAVHQPGESFIWKKAAPVHVVVASKPWQDVMDNINSKATIIQGHVRWATHANAHEDSAAHPFKEGKIIGCHNGIINNWRELATEFKHDEWVNDSQAAFGVLDAIKNPVAALDKLDGYWALSWTKGESLFFARTTDAPLAVAYVPVMRTLFWNSERTLLKKILDSAKLGDYDIWEPKPNTVYRYAPSTFGPESANGQKTDAPFRGRVFSKGRGMVNSCKPTTGVTTYNGGQYELEADEAWRNRKWDGVNAREVEVSPRVVGSQFKHPPRPQPKTRSYSLRDMDERIDALESRIETLESEKEYLYEVLNDMGAFETITSEIAEPAEPIDCAINPEARCAVCERGQEAGRLYEVPNEPTPTFTHANCIFVPGENDAQPYSDATASID